MSKTLKDILPFALSIYFVLGYWTLQAQEAPLRPTFRFETVNMPGGELGNEMQAIVQDSFGFMWFGSQFGLHRWDGYEFKTYLKDPEDSTAIASNYIESLYVSKDGTLWVGHGQNGLDRYDHLTETFQHVNLKKDGVNDGTFNTISTMVEDQKGNLWIGTGGGLIRFDVNTQKFERFQHDPRDPNSLSFNVCRVLYIDSKGTLWIGTGFPWGKKLKGGLNRFRPETQDFVRYLHDPNDPSTLTSSKVSAIFEDSKGNFWIGTCGDGLHLMDRQSGKMQRLEQDPRNPNQLCGPFVNDTPWRHIRFIFEDQNQKIWIGAIEGGIKYYDPETGYIRDYYYKGIDPQSLPGPNPWTMLQSKDGTYWVISKWVNAQVFKFNVTSFEYIPLEPEENTVYSFCESEDQNFWIGTDEAGLLTFDPNTKKLSTFDIPSKITNLKGPEIKYSKFQDENLLNWCLKTVEDEEGGLWIRKFLPLGIFRLDTKTGAAKLYQHYPEDTNSIGIGRVTDILKDEKGQIWFLTSQGDLNLFNQEEEKFIKYQFVSSRPPAQHQYYSLMAPSGYGTFWIVGTETGGNSNPLTPVLTRFDPVTLKFDNTFSDIIVDDPLIKLETIQGLLEDRAGNLWICSDSKLLKINLKSRQTSSFRAKQFELLYFKGIVMDDQGQLHLFGNKIVRLDPETGEHSSFVSTFSLAPTANFTQYVFKDSKGLIYFGGVGGFQILDPRRDYKNSTAAIKTIIKDFQFLDQPEGDNEMENETIHILTEDQIHLRYNQNAFTLRFGALAFQHPKSNRHQFKLEGYDEQWRIAGSEPAATYVKVPPGDYTFRVRGATLRSDWGPEKRIDIHISSPWWATWWAYSFYTLLGLGILYALYFFQVKSKLDRAEAYRLKELDTIKTQLYTNITHEFRTPLTVISGMASQIKENPKEWFSEGLAMIQRNSKRLLNLVNQMLDLSKLESGKMALSLQQGDIINYLKYIVESIHSFAESKKIQVHFHSEEEEVMMDFDNEKFQQIIINLLSNAVKFTPEGGHIYVSAEAKYATNENQDSSLKIKVRDTGLGIPESQIPNIFDRFYQVEDSAASMYSEGTGIGLALVKELIKLMGGEIAVKSKPQQGTEFTLILPIHTEAKQRFAPIAENVSRSTVISSTPAFAGTRLSDQVQDNGFLETSKPEVLLVEDNPDVVAYVASCLQDHYKVKVGKDGQEGIDIAIKNIPDLIITDVMMPYKDGFEVCNTLKNDERTSHIPIVMLTAKADIESKLEGLERGADAYLAKPFHKKELLIRIKKLLELRKNLQKHYLSVVSPDQRTIVNKDIPDVASLEDYFVRKARKVVEAHIDDFDFNVEKFCKEIGMSNSQLHRKLTALTGLSATKFLRFVRLNKAKNLLQNPQLTITAVAFETGFNDPSYFGRVFKKEFGITPMEWQERSKLINPTE